MTGAPPIVAAIEAVAARAPDRPALVRQGVPVAYRDLVRRVRALAGQMARAGIAPGDAVGITVDDTFAHILVSLALLRLGCRQVALPAHEPSLLREALARRLGLVAVVGAGPADAVGGAALLRPDLDAAEAAARRDDPAGAPPIGRGEVVMATSGTTGRPRLMVATEPMLVHEAAMFAGLGQVFLHLPSFDGNHSRRLAFRSLLTGGTEVLAGKMPARELAALVARLGVRRVHMAPPDLAALPDALGDAGWPAGTCLVTTGTRVPQPLRLRLQDGLGAALHVLYGTTEAGMVSIAGPADHAAHPDSVGRPLPGVEVAVTEEDGRPVPPGAEGLLRFRSPGAVRGYLDDPDADARAFPDGWFRPGDVGRLLPGGALLVAGRADDMMTLGVIKIFPAAIEAVAEAFPGVAECAAFAVASGALGDIPMLAVVAEGGLDTAALLAQCRARLGLRTPRRVVVLPALPRNAQGKVLRRDLAAMYRTEAP
jgi:acyl-CoA synthetase (AMP-forming)/AMP-acid ligase II